MKTSAISFSVLSLVTTLASLSLAVPALAATAENESPIRYLNIFDSVVNGTDDPFTRRSGDRYTQFASDYNCGDNYVYENNFGCGLLLQWVLCTERLARLGWHG
ncbi:hypothetical protein N7G274_004748 [Stereocaulon virgatum]|uniref:Uncharacterized protein n=1 Tax=Stereocaulon virgatum TaxID=373712 RepID=A0ABR4A910_9LECA